MDDISVRLGGARKEMVAKRAASRKARGYPIIARVGGYDKFRWLSSHRLEVKTVPIKDICSY